MKRNTLLVMLLLAIVALSYGQSCEDAVGSLTEYSNCGIECEGSADCLCDCYHIIVDAFEACDEACDYVGTPEFQASFAPYLAQCGQTGCSSYDRLCDFFERCGDDVNDDDDNDDDDKDNTNPDDVEFWSAIFCYVHEETCNFVDLVLALQEVSGAAVQVADDSCNSHDNFCDDIGAWGDDKKRQDAGSRRSVRIFAEGFATSEEADASYAAVQSALQDGGLDSVGVVSVSELNCGDCGNECKECSLEGKWNRVMEVECGELSGCPTEEGERDINIREVVDFRGDDEMGENEELKINQYWDFGEGECVGTWEGKFRFYSDASQCRVRTLDLGDCEASCDSTVSENLRQMVCSSANLMIDEEISSATFNNNCKNVRFQEMTFKEGEGKPNNNDDDDDDSDSGAGRIGDFAFVWALVFVLGYLL